MLHLEKVRSEDFTLFVAINALDCGCLFVAELVIPDKLSHTTKAMIDWCLSVGVTKAKKYRGSKLHLGVVRMALGNMARAHFRRLEIDKRKKK